MDISSGTSSAENNIRQSFFVFLRMDITNNIIWNVKITIYVISKNSAITIFLRKFRFVNFIKYEIYFSIVDLDM